MEDGGSWWVGGGNGELSDAGGIQSAENKNFMKHVFFFGPQHDYAIRHHDVFIIVRSYFLRRW